MQKIAILFLALCLHSCKTKHTVTTTNEQLSIHDIRHMQWIQRADLSLFDTIDVQVNIDTTNTKQHVIHYRTIRRAQAIATTAEQFRDTTQKTVQSVQTIEKDKSPTKQIIKESQYYTFFVALLCAVIIVSFIYKHNAGNGRPRG